MAKSIEGGVLDPDLDLDEVRANNERERIEILMQETAAAVREEKLAQALSELEHELLKVVHVELAEVLAERPLPPRTLALYQKDLAAFRKWCATYPTPLPPSPAAAQTVAGFLADLATTGGNVKRAAKAISRAHCNADLPDPTTDGLVRAVLKYCKSTPAEKPAN